MSRSACSKHILATVLEIMLRHLEQKQLNDCKLSFFCVCFHVDQRSAQSGHGLYGWLIGTLIKLKYWGLFCFSLMWKNKNSSKIWFNIFECAKMWKHFQQTLLLSFIANWWQLSHKECVPFVGEICSSNGQKININIPPPLQTNTCYNLSFGS